MRELPILFSTPMVQAILREEKTMTRRVIKPQPILVDRRTWEWPYATERQGDKWRISKASWASFVNPVNCMEQFAPYQVGDHLWVRETHYLSTSGIIFYRASDSAFLPFGNCWTPSIFMFKKYARIWLEVTAVKTERLQDITEEDIKKEGCPQIELATGLRHQWFRSLWDSINGKTHPWKNNDWVWVYTFKRIRQEMPNG